MLDFYSRDAMLVQYYLHMALCPSVCLSVTSRYCVETAERIELIFGVGLNATLSLSYTVLCSKGIRVSRKYGYFRLELCLKLWI